MKFHPIFQRPFLNWWLALAVLSIAKFLVFGLPRMYEEKNYGILFYTFGALLTGLVFGSILYLIYWVFSRKWNNKIFMILISASWLLFITGFQKNKEEKTDQIDTNIEFKDYSNLNIKLNEINYYHSEINNFRIKIPNNWELQKGQALGIEISSISPNKDGLLSIQIANLNDERITVESIPDDFFIILLKNNRLQNLKTLESKNISIANQKGKFSSIEFTYNHLNETINQYLESYVFIYNKKVYHIILKTDINSKHKYETEFKEILNSFMLENYK
jgi:hypothetical protein